jgi:hypothetical protein
MPYSIQKRGSEYCVIKDSDGSSVGCHATRGGAEAQRAAINISKSSQGPVARARSIVNRAKEMVAQEGENITSSDPHVGLTVQHWHDPDEPGKGVLVHTHEIGPRGIPHTHPGYRLGYLEKRPIPDPGGVHGEMEA